MHANKYMDNIRLKYIIISLVREYGFPMSLMLFGCGVTFVIFMRYGLSFATGIGFGLGCLMGIGIYCFGVYTAHNALQKHQPFDETPQSFDATTILLWTPIITSLLSGVVYMLFGPDGRLAFGAFCGPMLVGISCFLFWVGIRLPSSPSDNE
jgi:hypothetical protein